MTTSKMFTLMRLNKVVAFDPGFERLGVAVLERNHRSEVSLIFSDCVRTSKEKVFAERLKELGEAVERFINEFSPEALALEEIFFEKNQKTAMNVAAVRGMLSYIGASRGLTVFEYTPLQVKIAVTGYGKANKDDIALMVPKLLHLPSKKRLDDELDAIAIGITCLASERYPQ